MKRMSYLQKVARRHGTTQVLVPPRRFWTPAESPGIEERTVAADAGDRGVSRRNAAAPGRLEPAKTAPRLGRSGPSAARAEAPTPRDTETAAHTPRSTAPLEPAATIEGSVNASHAPGVLEETASPRETAAIDKGVLVEAREPAAGTQVRKAAPFPEPATPRHATAPELEPRPAAVAESRRSRITSEDDATREPAPAAVRHSRGDGSLAAGAAHSAYSPLPAPSAIEAGAQPRPPLPPGAVSRATPAPARGGDAEVVSSNPGATRAVSTPVSHAAVSEPIGQPPLPMPSRAGLRAAIVPVARGEAEIASTDPGGTRVVSTPAATEAVSEPVTQSPAAMPRRTRSRRTLVPMGRGDADVLAPESDAANATDAMFAQPVPPARAAAATPRRGAATPPAAEREARGGGDRSREEDERVEVRIGSIDVHVEPEPRRSPRPATPAPARPLARGFISSLGLRQG
jgi:hypothetical protein